MICASCGSEYRDGYIRCNDCDVDLADFIEPAAADADIHLVTVYQSDDTAAVSLYRSVLDDAGIPYDVRNEGVASFFGVGRFGPNLNFVSGPVEFYVRADDADEARELIEVIERPREKYDEETEQSTLGSLGALREGCFFVAGSILGPASLGVMYAYPIMGFVLLMLSVNIIEKSAHRETAAPSSDDHSNEQERNHRITSFLKVHAGEIIVCFAGMAIAMWGWDLIRASFPTFAASVPAGKESRVVWTAAATIWWFVFYFSNVGRLIKPQPRAAA